MTSLTAEKHMPENTPNSDQSNFLKEALRIIQLAGDGCTKFIHRPETPDSVEADPILELFIKDEAERVAEFKKELSAAISRLESWPGEPNEEESEVRRDVINNVRSNVAYHLSDPLLTDMGSRSTIPALEEIIRLRIELRRAGEKAGRREGENFRLQTERVGLLLTCERLCTELEQALRQWSFYADQHEEGDLDVAKHAEGDTYRAAVKLAKEWRDVAHELTCPPSGYVTYLDERGEIFRMRTE